jgi:hypothetical protein
MRRAGGGLEVGQSAHEAGPPVREERTQRAIDEVGGAGLARAGCVVAGNDLRGQCLEVRGVGGT